ncbi:putative nuclear RNA export factor SDE5 [Musa acuminata AAA Group]|uniref:putative nuclear RNA export factor SDE5 isoform X1 n=1 Tax=Musa acuminata AAA Group TaxID=214697 RepID=UPI0031CEA2FA
MSTLYTSEHDDETRALNALLDAFGTFCTLEDIASAYCKAGRDVCKAGDMLYQLQESSSSGFRHAQIGKNVPQPEESSDEDNLKCSILLGKNSKGTKPKKLSVSVGTISSVLGKKYVGLPSSRNESCETTKPPKLEIKEQMLDVLESESFMPNSVQSSTLNDKDVEEFLFSMLGDGFKLSMDVIRDVLGCCGYNMKKSMEELLIISSNTLEKGKAVDYDDLRKSAGKGSQTEKFPYEDCCPNSPSSVRNIPRHSSMEQKNSNLPMEVIQSLFNVPERSEEEQKIKRREMGLNRMRVVGQKAVTKPLEDLVLSSTTDIPNIRQVVNDGPVAEEDDDYQVLRRAAKLHWDSMKQYYEAAVDAFTRGDNEAASYHIEQGKYYNQKAREADEKSAAMLVEPRKTSNKDEITLDLQPHCAKEALKLSKLLLCSLADIPTLRYLKLVIGADSEDRKQGKKRRLVLKLLENESIKWTESDDNPGTIYIQLDQVNPKKLSFAKE